MLRFDKQGSITICSTAWPRDEHRWGYWRDAVASLEKFLNPSCQVSRWVVSCESDEVGDKDAVWRFCAEHGMDLIWRSGRANQGANINHLLAQVNTPWELMIEDDLGLDGPLSLGQQLRFMDQNNGDYLSFLWALQSGEGPMEGLLFEGLPYSVLEHDKMLWTFSNWPHLFRHSARQRCGSFDEWKHGLYANPECHYVHKVKSNNLRCFGYGQQAVGPGTAGVCRHLGNLQHSSIKQMYDDPPVVNYDLEDFQKKGFEVTLDWSAVTRRNWMFTELKQLWGLPLRYLEIGVMEAYTASWLLTRVMMHRESLYVGIGVWADNDVEQAQKERAIRNLGRFPREQTKLIECPSQDAMFTREWQLGYFDVVYVDGGHVPYQALMDMFFAWEMLRRGGYLIVDDMDMEGVRNATDQFLSHLPDWQWVQIERNKQLIVRKFPVYNSDQPCAIRQEQFDK